MQNVGAQFPSPVESRAFQRAVDAFTDGHFERAERAFEEFVTGYPGSSLQVEAILRQAQSALSQTNTARAIAIITTNLTRAGLLQDQYRYCLANAYLESGNLSGAAEAFAAIPRAMTNSSLLLEASYGEAQARFHLGSYAEATRLLQDPAGSFQRAIRSRPADKFALRGKMLQAEAQFRQGQFQPAEETLQSLPSEPLLPELRWERQYLICRLMVAERRYGDALVASTNLISNAASAANRTSLANSYFFQAGLIRQIGQLEEASLIYTNNLTDGTPPEHRRLALLNIIELKLAQDKTAEAIAMLDSFLARHPGDSASDLVQLTRGELELKLYLSAPTTNRPPGSTGPSTALQSALSRFEALLATNAAPSIRGKALLNKGWCLWLDQQIAASEKAFAAAVQTLPFSEDQAIARFKLADVYFKQGDYTNAIAHYRALTNDFVRLPSVRSTLFDQALYQTLNACVALDDEMGATATLRALLQSFPDSALADRSLFLVGQELLKRAKPRASREQLLEFIRRFPQSPLRPEVELAIARSFDLERSWPEAIEHYEKWLTAHPTNALRSRAAFDRASATASAGQSTNALMLFTTFVAEFQTDTNLAPKAQYRVAAHYHDLGQYREAIGNFQKILENTNWPTMRLTYQARFMAGLSAFSAQLWNDAEGHFTTLINDDTCNDNYPDIAAQAFFAYADTILNRDVPSTPTARPVQKYKEAKDIFNRIPLFFTNSPLVAAAWGRIGGCYLQMASEDPKQYPEATNAFLRAMTNITADVTVRSLAEIGLAQALEHYAATLSPPEYSASDKVAILKSAFDHLYNVLIGENLRSGEYSDPSCLKYAGLEAARIAEYLKQMDLSIAILRRVQKALPPIHAQLEERIRRLQESQRRDQL